MSPPGNWCTFAYFLTLFYLLGVNYNTNIEKLKEFVLRKSDIFIPLLVFVFDFAHLLQPT